MRGCLDTGKCVINLLAVCPRKFIHHWRKEVIDRIGNNDVVIHAEYEGNGCHSEAYACEKVDYLNIKYTGGTCWRGKMKEKMQLHWSGGIQKVMEFLYFISVFQTTEITISRTDQQFWLHLLVPNLFTCMIFYPPVLWYTQLTTANTFVYNFCTHWLGFENIGLNIY